MWKQAQFNLISASPMLMHNGALANPRNPYAKEMKKVSGKRTKTDADYERMAEIEFYGSLYLDEQLGIVIPAQNIEAMLVKAAGKRRRGPDAKMGLYLDQNIKLFYEGPKDKESLWANPEFIFEAKVNVNRASIIRTRPIFKNWGAFVPLNYDDEVINLETLIEWVNIAGHQIGLGDWRPKYGRFFADYVGS